MSAASEERPFGMAIPPVPAGVESPPESPEVSARALSVTARLLSGASAFFFLALVFAYFYLRSINQDHMWRPAHVKPDHALGAVWIALTVVSALAAIVAGRLMKREQRNWLGAAVLGLILGLASIGVQCIEYTQQDFGPTDGAFASVFCMWTAFYLLFVLMTMYWFETQVATELRARREPAHSHGDVREPDRLIAPGLDAAVFYWAFLAAIGVLTYVVLYLLQ